MSKKVQLLMFLDPQIDCDMTRIGCRVSRMEQCNLCKGCYNKRRCIHLERWKRVKQERERIIAKSKKHHLRGGVCGSCKDGYTDIGLICSKPLSCHTWADWNWDSSNGGFVHTECTPDQSYGKCNDEIRGFFEVVSDKLKEVFGPSGPLAQVFDPHLNGVAAAFEQLGTTLSNALDPEKNGVAAAFRKFGDDVESAFQEIGNKIKDFFVNIGNSIVEGMKAFGEMLSQFGDNLKDFFSDPQNIIGLIATIMSGIGSVLPPPLSNLMSVLAACTTIIGNAAIGAPFDPMSLVDLAGAFILPPQSQLAKTIASDVSKAATVVGKIATKVTSTATNSLKAVNTAAKNFSKLSAVDKALSIGKATAKVASKAAQYVGKQSVSGLGPIGATQSPEDQASDDALGQQLNQDQADPQRDVNAAAMDAQIQQDNYDTNLWTAQYGGTEEGELASKDQLQRTQLKQQFTNPYNNITNELGYQLSTSDPQSFTDDEKFYYYGQLIDTSRAQLKTQAAQQAQLKKTATQNKSVADAQKELDAATTPATKYVARMVLQTAQDEANSELDKDAEETRKYGLTYAQAKSMMKQYQDEIDKFSGKSGGRKTRRGGSDDTQSIVPTPEYFPEDKVDRGEELGYGVPLYPPIVTPTFFHFAKKFPEVPDLKNPNNWFTAYNKFRTDYDKVKTDYNALVESNEQAINARNTLPMAEHDKLYQDYLAQASDKKDPLKLAPEAKAKGPNDYLNFIGNLGYTPHTWNEMVTSIDRTDLSIDEVNEQDLHPDVTAPEIIPPLPQEFHVPDAQDFEKTIGSQKLSNPWSGKKTGGAILVQPPREAILSYYRSILGSNDPMRVLTEDDMMKQFDIDWKTKPAVIASSIRSNSIQHNQMVKGAGRRRSLTDFFGLRGGATTDPTPPGYSSDYKSIYYNPTNSPTDQIWVSRKPQRDATEAYNNQLAQTAAAQAAADKAAADAAAPNDAIKAAAYAASLAAAPPPPGYSSDYKSNYYNPTNSPTDQIWVSRKQQRDEMEAYAKQQAIATATQAAEDSVDPAKIQEKQNNVAVSALRKKYPDATSKISVTFWSQQLPDAFKAYLAASPKDKLIQRQQIRGLMEYGRVAYGLTEFMDESDPARSPRESFEDDVIARAPELLDLGDSKTPDDVAAEKKATTGTAPLAGSGSHVAPTMVMENLWLGNRDDALDVDWLKNHNIHAVFNCTKNIDFAPGVKQYRFPIDDDEKDVDIMTHEAPRFVKKILKEMERGPVLVHCIEGRQRSPAIVALTMWIKKQGTGGGIRRELKKLRPIVFSPQATFEKSLQRWMN